MDETKFVVWFWFLVFEFFKKFLFEVILLFHYQLLKIYTSIFKTEYFNSLNFVHVVV